MTYLRQKYKKKPSFVEEYEKNMILSKNDVTRHIPNKRIKKRKLPSGLYGYTSLGMDYMVINNNLTQEKDYETQIHEAIHTNDEYETRLLTQWILENIKEQDLNNKNVQ